MTGEFGKLVNVGLEGLRLVGFRIMTERVAIYSWWNSLEWNENLTLGVAGLTIHFVWFGRH